MPSEKISLSHQLLSEARDHSYDSQRSIQKQIEYWARLGQIAEEHPDLSFRFVRDILISMEQYGNGNGKTQ